MHEHSGRGRVGVLLAGGLAVLAGAWGYNAGLVHGLATQLPAPAAGAVVYPYYRPWGLGFPFFPLFFLLFWFVAARAFIGRGRWRGGPGGYYGHRHGVPPMFEEWHRRAHEQDRKAAPDVPAQG